MSSAEDSKRRSNPFELLTVMEAAEELRVGRTRIYEMVASKCYGDPELATPMNA